MIEALHFQNKQDHILRYLAEGLAEELRVLADVSLRHVLGALTRKRIGPIFKKSKKEKYRIVKVPGKTYRVWGD